MTSVSQEMRISVLELAISKVVDMALLRWESAKHFPDARCKSQSSNNDHEPRRCVQPFVEKISEHTAEDNRADQREWKLHGNRRIIRDFLRFFKDRRSFGIV